MGRQRTGTDHTSSYRLTTLFPRVPFEQPESSYLGDPLFNDPSTAEPNLGLERRFVKVETMLCEGNVGVAPFSEPVFTVAAQAAAWAAACRASQQPASSRLP